MQDIAVICTGTYESSALESDTEDFNVGKEDDLVPIPAPSGPTPGGPSPAEPCSPWITIGNVRIPNPPCPSTDTAPEPAPQPDPSCGFITIGTVTIPDPACSAVGRRLLADLNLLQQGHGAEAISDDRNVGRKMLS
eukprot:361579-Chlamydomonas_euryale.AAC.5